MGNILGKIWNFIKLSRVQFLLGGFLLYALGAAAATRMVNVNWAAYWLGQAAITSIQLMAQYLNEYYDREVDSLAENKRTWFSGGSGILSEGSISPKTIMYASRICLTIAILASAMAFYLFSWMMPIIIISLFGSWFYSSPPISLMSSGWGELTTSIIVALLVPLAGCIMQGGYPTTELLLVCIPLILVHVAMLISFEFPDCEVDQLVGKKTLTVRLGFKKTIWVADLLIAFSIAFVAVLFIFSKYVAGWMGWVFPLAIWQMVMMHKVINSPTRKHYSLLTAGGVGLFSIMAILAFFGFIL